jgi:hypothetical protein
MNYIAGVPYDVTSRFVVLLANECISISDWWHLATRSAILVNCVQHPRCGNAHQCTSLATLLQPRSSEIPKRAFVIKCIQTRWSSAQQRKVYIRQEPQLIRWCSLAGLSRGIPAGLRRSRSPGRRTTAHTSHCRPVWLSLVTAGANEEHVPTAPKVGASAQTAIRIDRSGARTSPKATRSTEAAK